MSDNQPPPPPPSQPPTGPDETASKPWWKRWWGITLIVVLVFAALGTILEDPDTDEVAAEATESEEPSPEPSPTPDPTTPATEMADEVTEPEPTPTPTPSPTYQLTEEDMRTSVFPLVFDSSREGILQILRDMHIVESVDLYEYDAAEGLVRLSITPAYDFDEGVRDDAWTIMREFATLYTADSWLHPDFEWSPSLDVEISTAHYRCEGETLIAVQDARASRSDWEAACRVS